MRVFLELAQRLGIWTIAPQRTPPTPLERVQLAYGAVQSAISPGPIKEASDVVFFGYSRRIRSDDGLWSDPHIDPLLDGIPWRYVYVEQRHRRRRYRPVATRCRVQHDYFDLQAAIHRKIVPFRLSAADRRILDEAAESLKNEFGVTLDLVAIAEPILDRRRCLIPVYRRFFQRVRPKALIVVSPNCAEMAAVETARGLGIRTAELQHGVIGRYDPAYSFPRNCGPLQCTTDDLLLFGNFWRDELQGPAPNSTLRTVGFQYLQAASQQRIADKPTNQIVFLSQSTIGDRLSKFAVELSRHPQRAGRIVYRLHPDEFRWREQYPWLADAPLKVDEGGDRPLHSLLSESRIQVGVYSFALLEGLQLGLRTYLLQAPGVESLAGLEDRSAARIVRHVEEILTDSSDDASPAHLNLFAPDALQNFHAYLGDAIGGRLVPPMPATAARSA